ncbi:peptidoglycan-binding protein [Streptosporangium lutulentum]
MALIAVAAAGVVAVALAGHEGKPETAGTVKPHVEIASVVKTDLSDTRTLPGSLGFGAERPLRGVGEGLVTRLPKAGAAVLRGKPLYWVDDRPVTAFFGDTPLFRKLGEEGVQGRDVTVVANNLKALGYDIGLPPPRTSAVTTAKTAPGADASRVPLAGRDKPLLPGDVFTASLGAALKRWQLDSGLEPTGTLDVGQVVVLPGPVRVGSVKAQLGDVVAEELMTVTSTRKVVTVPVDATDVGTIRRGTRMTVVLPDDKKISGKVTAIGKDTRDNETPGGSGTPQLNVTVTPDRSTDVKALDSAAVQVNVTSRVRRGVLAVPVGALLALREGGYALQLTDGRLVAAETGMFARGMVEVSGDGITSGLKVVTSS